MTLSTARDRPVANELHRLARLHGIQTSYQDISGRRINASRDVLLDVLKIMGVPIASAADARDARRHASLAAWRRPLDPVTVVSDGVPFSLRARLAPSQLARFLSLVIETDPDDASARTKVHHLEAMGGSRFALPKRVKIEGITFAEVDIPVPGLPPGYYTARLSVGGHEHTAVVVCAPKRAPLAVLDRDWGLFVPAYALHSEKSWGAGDLGDLRRLGRWMGDLGGRALGTLPLLSSYLDHPFDPSPYAPVSRLFWNEFYLEIEQLPEADSPRVRKAIDSAPVRSALDALRKEPRVDFQRIMALKRGVLETAADVLFSRDEGERKDAFRRFVAQQPEVETYARFRATMERRREPWQQWPSRLRDGELREGDYDEASYRYHLYVQFAASEQITGLAADLKQRGSGLYLDLPLGAHGGGYDVWRHRDLFVHGIDTGAPPDDFFSRGQNWGFPPLHPVAMEVDAGRYWRRVLRHQMAVASVLRIDHVLCFHRLFWIPGGREAREGVYVRYPSELMYAIARLEACRAGTVLVGEDLGTVAPEVRRKMHSYGLLRTYALQFELSPDGSDPIARAPADAVMSLNTHDMPPFRGYWAGDDIRLRRELGLLDDKGVAQACVIRKRTRNGLVRTLRKHNCRVESAEHVRGVVDALLRAAAATPTRLLLVNLEDLWLERRPQNVPGTGPERPNWVRKTRYPLERIVRMRGVRSTLTRIDACRKAGRQS